MNRRRLLTTLILCMSLAAGAAAWWLVGHLLDHSDAAVKQLYALELKDSAGAPVRFAAWRGKPLVVNFWASWCAPCREEMPLLDKAARSEKSIQFVGISVDDAEHVKTYLASQAVSYPLPLTGMEITSLSAALGNKATALPFTAFISADGKLVGVKLGALKEVELQDFLGKIRP